MLVITALVASLASSSLHNSDLYITSNDDDNIILEMLSIIPSVRAIRYLRWLGTISRARTATATPMKVKPLFDLMHSPSAKSMAKMVVKTQVKRVRTSEKIAAPQGASRPRPRARANTRSQWSEGGSIEPSGPTLHDIWSIGVRMAKRTLLEEGYKFIAQEVDFRGDTATLQVTCDLVMRREDNFFCIVVRNGADAHFTARQRYYIGRGDDVGFFVDAAAVANRLNSVEPQPVQVKAMCFAEGKPSDCSSI